MSIIGYELIEIDSVFLSYTTYLPTIYHIVRPLRNRLHIEKSHIFHFYISVTLSQPDDLPSQITHRKMWKCFLGGNVYFVTYLTSICSKSKQISIVGYIVAGVLRVASQSTAVRGELNVPFWPFNPLSNAQNYKNSQSQTKYTKVLFCWRKTK